MSLEEAANHLLEMREERSSKKHKFDEDEYIEQRFGVNPEASSNSFVKVLHSDVKRGKQLATLRHKVVLETSTLMLEDLLFNGVQEPTTELEEVQVEFTSVLTMIFSAKSIGERSRIRRWRYKPNN